METSASTGPLPSLHDRSLTFKLKVSQSAGTLLLHFVIIREDLTESVFK